MQVVEIWDFQASLVYIVSSRTPKANSEILCQNTLNISTRKINLKKNPTNMISEKLLEYHLLKYLTVLLLIL